MCELCNEEIESIFEEIKLKSKLLQEKYGVIPISNPYSDFGLALVYLYKHLEKPVKINDIREFVLNHHISNSKATCQIRHLRTDNGYYLLGSNGVHNDIRVKRDEYMLVTLDEPHPNFVGFNRHKMLSSKKWKTVKEKHNNCCVICGAREGEPSPHNNKVITYLQQGHMDPSKEMSVDNCIPQCQFCNGVAKDNYIFDNDGNAYYNINSGNFIKSFQTLNDKLKAYLLLEEELKELGVIK